MDSAPSNQAGGLHSALLGGFKPYLLLTLLCLGVFAPGLGRLPPLDRDEARFMQATKQMIETGDFVDIRFQDEARNKKPVGIYWLQAAAVSVGGDLTAPWLYRLPSAMAAWLAVLVTFAIGRRLFDPLTGLMSGAMLATTLVTIAEAHIAKTDAALLCAVTLCLGALGNVYVRGEAGVRNALVFWLALAAGVLIKGPVIVMIAGAAGLALCVADRRLRWVLALRPVIGLAIIAAAGAAWFVLQSRGVADTAGGGFVVKSFREDILPKIIGSQEHHGAPPGTYIALSLATAWPWSLLAPFALLAGWRERAVPATRFCLAWLIPAWLVFELVPTKLPHYTLPLMPPLMLLAAHGINTGAIGAWLTRGPGIAYRILWACIAVALAAGGYIAGQRYGDGSMIGPGLLAGIALGTAIYAIRRIKADASGSLVASLTLAAAAFSIVLFAGVLPHLTQLAMSPRLAARARPLMSPGIPVAVAGYHEPSAVFLLGTGTILTDTAAATDHTIAHTGALAVIPAEKLPEAEDRLARAGRVLTPIDEIDGYDYSSGKWEKLHLVSSRPREDTP